MANENQNQQCGIACPGCGAVENYAGKKNVKNPDNSIYRTKECNACGQTFSTLEVPIALVEVKKRTRTTQQPPVTQ